MKLPHPPHVTPVTFVSAGASGSRQTFRKNPSQQRRPAHVTPLSPDDHTSLSWVPKYRSVSDAVPESCPVVSVIWSAAYPWPAAPANVQFAPPFVVLCRPPSVASSSGVRPSVSKPRSAGSQWSNASAVQAEIDGVVA